MTRQRQARIEGNSDYWQHDRETVAIAIKYCRYSRHLPATLWN